MIKLIMLFIFLNISLFARTNPFESNTLTANIETKTNNEISVKQEVLENEDDGNRTVKVEHEVSQLSEKEKIIISKPLEEKKEIKLSKKEIEKICQVENKKTMEKKKKLKKVKSFTPTTYKVYPFLTIDVDSKNLTITTRKRYPIIKYYTIKSENKLVFNFDAKIHFNTRYKKLHSPKFTSYALGNHRDKHLFRVVIVTKKDIKNYEVIIKNNIAKIIYKK